MTAPTSAEDSDTSPAAVYIASAGHSGSTILDILLGAHSRVFSTGELFALVEAISRNHPCACGESIRSCALWNDVRKSYQQTDGFDMFRRPRRLAISYRGVLSKHQPRGLSRLYFGWLALRRVLGEAGHNYPLAERVNRIIGFDHDAHAARTIDLYERLRRLSDTTTIVDSTKEPFRMHCLHKRLGEQMRVIRLTRDGRGVFYSEVRKQGLDPVDAARSWLTQNLRIDYWLGSIPEERVFRLSYEELCADTANVLRQLSDWLGLAVEPAQTHRAGVAYHYVSGNPRVAQRPKDRPIRLDDEWRTELTADELHVFDAIAGPQNRRYGYAN